jgi:hypothetical protein
VELTVTRTRRPQDCLWPVAHKLKPQRGTMLLLTTEKDISLDDCSFFVWVSWVNAAKNFGIASATSNLLNYFHHE